MQTPTTNPTQRAPKLTFAKPPADSLTEELIEQTALWLRDNEGSFLWQLELQFLRVLGERQGHTLIWAKAMQLYMKD